MKKIIRFNRFFPAAVVLSSVLIILGIVSLCTRGINWGLEFKPGQNIQVSISGEGVDSDKIVGVLAEKGFNAAVKAAGETESGITIHYVSDVCDVGDIIRQEKTPIYPSDTIDDIAAKIHHLEKEFFPQTICLYIHPYISLLPCH